MEWISNKGDSINIFTDKKGILLPSNLFEISYVAKINQYQSYLLLAVVPQLLFALLLLLITTAAFRISYIFIKKQQKLITIKNEFISNITHELKTPVSTVKVALEALMDFDMKKDPKVVNDYLEMSLLEMNRLDLLISKVLNNSVLENGKHMFSPEETSLKNLIEEAIQSMQYRLSKNEANIQFNCGQEDINANLDKIHIQGVLINLIDNSLKYAGENPQISIKLFNAGNDHIIEIKDNGPGIPEEYLDKVFEKFFRVPTGDKHNVKGYGLGLNYAKLVIKHHQGSIKVKNLSEGGCLFILRIPKKNDE